ncbi:MAG: hypothetical protein R6X35_09820 [Candidatus Krumholzibacteriia bacterium]
MDRLIVVVIACTGLLAGAACPAAASGPRLFALGGDGAFLEDVANTRAWCGGLAEHGGWLAVQTGPINQYDGYTRDQAGWRTIGPAAGVHLPLGADGRHGTAALWWDGRAAGGGSGELGDDRLADAWQIQYGRRFGGLAAAFSVRHGGGEHAYGPSLRLQRTRDEFGLGARFDLGERAYVDLAGELVQLAQDATVDQAVAVSRATADSYGLRGRAFVQAGTGLVLVPVVEHRREGRDGDPVLGSPGFRLWRLGAGLTWLPDPDHLVLLAADWRDARHETDAALPFTSDVVSCRLAVEARIHALLSVRLASGYRRTALDLDAGGRPTFHDVPVSAGLAVHLGPADLDLAVANAPPTGPDGLPGIGSLDDDDTWLTAGLSWWF